MYKSIFLILAAFWISKPAFAQDTLTKRDGSTQLIFALTIEQDTLKFRNFTQPDGPIRHMAVRGIKSIHYQDGRIFPEPVEENKTAMLPGYDAIKPYLKYKEGNLNYYARIGYHVDFYLAYDESGDFEKIRHDKVSAGCVSHKQEMLQFFTGDLGVPRNGGYELREGKRYEFFVLVNDGEKMILATDLMEVDRTRVASMRIAGTYGTPGVFSPRVGLNGTKDSNVKYYFYDGQNVRRIRLSMEDVNEWKETFGDCPAMTEVFELFENTPKEGIDEDELVIGLLEALTDAYYNACYIQVEK